MDKTKGYLLPSGAAYTDDMQCVIVFYPDKVEYRRALLGSLSYLATWIAWEKESEHKGIDAALSWKIALDLTVECWDMACFEQLQSDVSDILEHLQSSISCCDEQITTGIATEFETDIDPGVGDAPDYYGETAIADWDDWEEYVCHNAHLWVDNLILQSYNVAAGLESGGMSISLLSLILIGISFFVVGGLLGIGFLMLGLAGLVAAGSSSMFEEAANDIETARDDIVCSLILGLSLADAVEDALASGTAWDLFYTLIDFDSATAIIYEGGDGETYLEAETRSDCICVQTWGEFQVTYDIEPGTSYHTWQHDTGEFQATGGNPDGCLYGRFDTGKLWMSSNILRALQGYGTSGEDDDVTIHKIEFDYRMTNATVGRLKVEIDYAAGGWLTYYYDNSSTWVHVVLDFTSVPKTVLGGDVALRFTAIEGTGNYFYLDNIYFDYDCEE